ncbi:MAG: hypothetical protein AAFP69_16080 [Planctomycetota bacterium]
MWQPEYNRSLDQPPNWEGAPWRLWLDSSPQRVALQSVTENAGPLDLVTLMPTSDDVLPMLTEQYARGGELFSVYPQPDTSDDTPDYGIKYCILPNADSESILQVRLVTNVQTLLLDCHPTIDLVPGGTVVRRGKVDTAAHVITDVPAGNIAADVTIAERDGLHIALLLGSRDQPFTGDHSDDGRTRLTLFEEFLEKGVIRTAMPWILVSAETISDDQILNAYHQSGHP